MGQFQQAGDLIVSSAEREAIIATSLDYIVGWYSGDAARMKRCLHPEMVKRAVLQKEGAGLWRLSTARSAEDMVAFTGEGGGSDVPEPRRENEVTILDTHRRTASVKVVSHEYVDYLHLGKVVEGWKIVNVLWEPLEDMGE